MLYAGNVLHWALVVGIFLVQLSLPIGLVQGRSARGCARESHKSCGAGQSKASKRIRRLTQDAHRVTAYVLNEIDERLDHVCSVTGLRVNYLGPLADSPRGSHLADRTASYLQWTILMSSAAESDLHRIEIFAIDISLKQQTESVIVCDIEGVTVYVNVTYISDDMGPDDPLEALAGESVRAFLLRVSGSRIIAKRTDK